MSVLFGLIVLLILGLFATVFFSIWGLPVVVVALALIALYLNSARKEDSSVGTMEAGRGPEPTGRPRKATGEADTANRRVGQT